ANPILEKLQERGQVDLVLFAGDAVAAEKTTLESGLDQVPEQVHMGLSNLSQALKASAGSTESGKSPVSSYILLTDGRDNSQLNPVSTAEQLGQMQVPVYPVILGSSHQPKDISIASLDYPQTAFKDDKPLLKARIGTSGYEGQEIRVILKQNDREVAVKNFKSQGVSKLLEFELDSGKLGRQEYTVETSLLPGETRDDNNEKSFAINIVDDKSHVLLVEETARWEFRFLHNALERDKRIDLQQVLFEQPYMGLLPQPFFPNQLLIKEPPKNEQPNLDNKPHPFSDKDLIIIGDVSPEHLENWEHIQTFVADQGGTLVLLAGKKYLPLAHRSEILNELLPLKNLKVVDWNQANFKVPPEERGMRLRLTPEGEAEPLFQFDVNPETNRDIWAELPGHLWFLQGELKPGASVLAYGVSPFNAPLDEEKDGVIIQRQ
ncbi:MAG: VWA domain-containing protein, partial [Planctomycetaceae bacterium]|nr:VWA domain-containing protein [Planctomycetaceae bacterium]